MDYKFKISPSIASSNLLNLHDEIKKVENRFDNLHIDIEDGNFVKNITFGLKMISKIRSITNLPFSVHLMVTNPDDYLEELFELGCSHIFIHVECSMYIKKYINKIKKHNIKAGIALNPISNIDNYEYLFKDIDSILYLTSEPDGNGELFQDEILKKIKSVDDVEIWIDGGVNFSNIYKLPEFTNYVVMGRAIFTK